ncbi:MAG: DUF202 domain-containing protein [Chloroflexi bacterium]|nr:DUF202 domain-containing protein [Chloroflexota bacterium]
MSDAEIRTHLANERTYLAWMRTVIVGMGIGLAAVTVPVRGGGLSRIADLLGILAVVASAVLSIWATFSYRRTLVQISRGIYSPAWGMVLFSLLVPMAAAGAVIAFFFASR